MLPISSPFLVLSFYSPVLRGPIQRVHPGTYEYVGLNLMLGSVIHDVSVDKIPCVIRTLDHSQVHRRNQKVAIKQVHWFYHYGLFRVG